jgi:hypothetical protein
LLCEVWVGSGYCCEVCVGGSCWCRVDRRWLRCGKHVAINAQLAPSPHPLPPCLAAACEPPVRFSCRPCGVIQSAPIRAMLTESHWTRARPSVPPCAASVWASTTGRRRPLLAVFFAADAAGPGDSCRSVLRHRRYVIGDASSVLRHHCQPASSAPPKHRHNATASPCHCHPSQLTHFLLVPHSSHVPRRTSHRHIVTSHRHTVTVTSSHVTPHKARVNSITGTRHSAAAPGCHSTASC